MHDLLTRIAALELDAMTKGIPAAAGPLRLDAVGRAGWNLLAGDLPLPLLTLRRDRLHSNLHLMRAYADQHGVSLAPHGKTALCPQLFRVLLEEGGAWGITAATVQQAAVMAASGAERVLIANQVIGRANVTGLVALQQGYPAVRFYCLVDSAAAAAQLAAHARPLLAGGRLNVLLEVGHIGGRTGVRDRAQAEATLAAVRAEADVLVLTGIEGYEGTLTTTAGVDAFLAEVVTVFQRVTAQGGWAGLDEVLLTAGGSAYFDRVVAAFQSVGGALPLRIVLRGGCYMTYDHGLYRRALHALDQRGGLALASGPVSALQAFLPALELWSCVQSRNEPGTAILTMGKRDLPYDAGFPLPLAQYRDGQHIADLWQQPGWAIRQAYDQHSLLDCPAAADLRVGDMIVCGISHPCTAFDKWDVLYLVDEHYTVTDALKTFFLGKSMSVELAFYLEKISRSIDLATFAQQVLHPDEIVAHYTQRGAGHLALCPDGRFSRDGYYAQARMIERTLAVQNAQTVLELASGQGFNTVYLASRHPALGFVGIDLAPAHLALARRAAARAGLTNASFEQGDFHTLTFPDASFDHVFAIESLCHARDLPAVFAEVARVLKPGGMFSVFDGFRKKTAAQLSADEQLAATLVEKALVVDKPFPLLQEFLIQAQSAGLTPIAGEDLSVAVLPNLHRLRRLACAYFQVPWLTRLFDRVLPPYLAHNAVAALLLPATVAAGIQGYGYVAFGRSGRWWVADSV